MRKEIRRIRIVCVLPYRPTHARWRSFHLSIQRQCGGSGITAVDRSDPSLSAIAQGSIAEPPLRRLIAPFAVANDVPFEPAALGLRRYQCAVSNRAVRG